MTPLTDKEAAAQIGEGLHTGLRKVCDSQEAALAYRGIDQMPDDEWRGVLSFLIDGLKSQGIVLVQGEKPAT